MLSLFACIIAVSAAVVLGRLPISASNVEWLSQTPFDGSNYADGMPLGNGRVVVLTWSNTSGLEAYIRSPLAQHTDTTLFTIARLSVTLSPAVSAGSYFNQTLHLEDGSTTMIFGGTSFADYVYSLRIYVDANSDTVMISANAGPSKQPFNINASLTSLRPSDHALNYSIDFYCEPSLSRPDAVPAGALPTPAPAGSIAIYHVNDVSKGDTSLHAYSFTQQQLGALLPQFPDPLDGRIFGAGLVGAAGEDGDGTPLVRAGPGLLVSSAPAAAFVLALPVRIDPSAGANETAYLSALSADLAGALSNPPPLMRSDASSEWWAQWWNRSYIDVPQSPPLPTVTFSPCDGSLEQVVLQAPSTGSLTFSVGGQCFVTEGTGNPVYGGPCDATAGVWHMEQCSAANCVQGMDFWVQNSATGYVLGFPGGVCPTLVAWTADIPAGSLKNEIFRYNATDRTLRSGCSSCPGTCAGLQTPSPPPPPGTSVLGAQYARTRFVQAAQVRGSQGVHPYTSRHCIIAYGQPLRYCSLAATLSL